MQRLMYNNFCVTKCDTQFNIGSDAVRNVEKYSRGRRGAPAKGVGRATGARVQIPLSPLSSIVSAIIFLRKNVKKYLTRRGKSDILTFHTHKSAGEGNEKD